MCSSILALGQPMCSARVSVTGVFDEHRSGRATAHLHPSELIRRRSWGEGATTLEWMLPSPPPFHQFDTLPLIK